MKKKYLFLMAIIIIMIPSCSKTQSQEEQKDEVTIVGKWQSFEYYELDDSGTHVLGRELQDTFFATFTETDAELDDGSVRIKSTYVERELTPKVYDFPQAREQGYRVIAQIKDGYLGVTIESDRYVCRKVK